MLKYMPDLPIYTLHRTKDVGNMRKLFKPEHVASPCEHCGSILRNGDMLCPCELFGQDKVPADAFRRPEYGSAK